MVFAPVFCDSIYIAVRSVMYNAKMSCSFSSTVDRVCGPTPSAPNELYVIPLKSCRKDLTDYLTNLGVSGLRDTD